VQERAKGIKLLAESEIPRGRDSRWKNKRRKGAENRKLAAGRGGELSGRQTAYLTKLGKQVDGKKRKRFPKKVGLSRSEGEKEGGVSSTWCKTGEKATKGENLKKPKQRRDTYEKEKKRGTFAYLTSREELLLSP